jgi:hypothetical protein
MKKTILLSAAVAFLAATIFSSAFTVEAHEKHESHTIDYLQNTKPPVKFPHKMHSAKDGNNIACNVCHHKLKEGNDPRACKKCHVKGAITKVDEGDAPDPCFNEKCTKNIFHERCKGCHKEKGKGPTKCKECHVKVVEEVKE